VTTVALLLLLAGYILLYSGWTNRSPVAVVRSVFRA
jgi:hypothetical protein